MSNTAAAAMNALAELAKNGHLGALEKLCQLAHVRDPSTGANFAPASDTTEKSQSGGGGAAKTATTKPSGGAAKTNPHGAIAPPSTYAKTTCDGAKAAAFAAKQNTKAAAEAEAKAAAEVKRPQQDRGKNYWGIPQQVQGPHQWLHQDHGGFV